MSLFGTDGIRGRAGEGALSGSGLATVGKALASLAGAGRTVVIGRDTRQSGPSIQSALEAELTRAGVDVIRLGVLPTPATALLTVHHEAALGIMITASHNPWHDNGIKVLGPDGLKLSDAQQGALEAAVGKAVNASDAPGRVVTDPSARDHYIAHLVNTVPGLDLSGLDIVVDAAHGAGSGILEDLLRTFGAKPYAVASAPDGRNINEGVGSTAPDVCREAVLARGADFGVALDGDADRVLLIDAGGRRVDGDQILARLAADRLQGPGLPGKALVSTVMANMGLELWCRDNGVGFDRTPVGDRHVAQRMSEIGARIGGEPSGHILLTEHSTTGDGCLAALHLAASLMRGGRDSEDHFHVFDPVPQCLRNARVSGGDPLGDAGVRDAIATQEARLGDTGRVLVRPSGTEPVIRVMAEGTDAEIISDAVAKIVSAIEASA